MGRDELLVKVCNSQRNHKGYGQCGNMDSESCMYLVQEKGTGNVCESERNQIENKALASQISFVCLSLCNRRVLCLESRRCRCNWEKTIAVYRSAKESCHFMILSSRL